MRKIVFLHVSPTTPRPSREIPRVIKTALHEHTPDLLIGPEYLFTGGEKGVYTEQERNELISALLDLSIGHHVVLIPGTIAWGMHVCSSLYYQNSAPVIHNGKLIANIKKVSLCDSDIRICQGTNVTALGGSFNRMIFDMAVPSKRQAYIDTHSVKINGITYCIEVCDDHSATAHAGLDDSIVLPKFADVQVILSAHHYGTFDTKESKFFLKDGGILIECNGISSVSYVGRLNGSEVTLLAVKKRENKTTDLISVDF